METVNYQYKFIDRCAIEAVAQITGAYFSATIPMQEDMEAAWRERHGKDISAEEAIALDAFYIAEVVWEERMRRAIFTVAMILL